MHVSISSLFLLSNLSGAAQESAPLPQDVAPQDAAAAELSGSEGAAVDSEVLRQRIHEMRMNLLLGGDLVRKAEGEAADFYSQKLELVEQRRDSLGAELSEKRASYELALDRALSAEGQAALRATGEAAQLRAEVAALEAETADLSEKRGAISKLVGSIQERDRERQSLVAQLETSGDIDASFTLPLMSIGLAPAAAPVGARSPYEDRQLMQDLLERDPRGARRVLFQADPQRYWQVFPLRPQPEVVARAVPFPPPDLPGRR